MAAPRGGGLRPGGVVRAIGRLVLLVALGFGAGLLIGIFAEEPDLLLGHLRGESVSVTLASEAQEAEGQGALMGEEGRRVIRDEPIAGPLPGDLVGDKGSEADREPATLETRRAALAEVTVQDVAASLPVVAAARAPERPAVAREAPEESGTSSPAPPAGHWAIQVGAFSEESAADQLVESLAEKGYPVELIPATNRTKRWRVRLQPIEGESRARELAERLKREERLPTWVVRMEARSDS